MLRICVRMPVRSGIFIADCCASANEMPTLSIGHYRPKVVDEDLLAYFREFDDTTLLIVLNLTSQAQLLAFEQGRRGKILASTGLDRDGEDVTDSIALRGDEGLVIRL